MSPGEQRSASAVTLAGKQIGVLAFGVFVVGLFLGALIDNQLHATSPSSLAVSSDKADHAQQAADVKTIAVEKQAVTSRRQAAKRVEDEVQRETATSDLAEFLGAIASGGDGSPPVDPSRAPGDVGHRPDPLAPGVAP